MDTIFDRTGDLPPAASASKSSPSTTIATGHTSICGCNAKITPAPSRCWTCSNGMAAGGIPAAWESPTSTSSANVHADQFSMFRTFGNVKERKFSEIWQDLSDPIMAGLKNRLPLLKGRCAGCRFKEICGGALRAGPKFDRQPLGIRSGVLSDG